MMNNKFCLYLLPKGIKRCYVLAFMLGSFSAVGFAPTLWFPALWISVPWMLYLAFSQKQARHAWFMATCYGFGHFFFGLYWITFSILTQAETFWWVVPFAVTGIALLLSCYIALPVLFAFAATRSWGRRTIIVVSLWLLGEMLRGYTKSLFTLYGFPWNLMGYSLSFSTQTAQIAHVIGIYGLSLLAIISVVIPVLALRPDYSVKIRLGSLIFSVMIPCLLWGYGYVRLQQAPIQHVPGVTLRLVQAGIADHHHWDDAKRYQILQQNIRLSMTKQGLSDVTHIVWSESSLPYLIPEHVHSQMPLIQEIMAVIPAGGALLTGALRLIKMPNEQHLYSTIFAFNDQGKIEGKYDKIHLVPFGEYVPLRYLLFFIDALGGTDFKAGDAPKTLYIPAAPPVSPLICYDVIFPHTVIDPSSKPDWIVNLTNDGWFEKFFHINDYRLSFSSGPYQHYEMARMRAIENGVPLVRVANTGISGVFDAYGRTLNRLDYGKAGIIDSPLPKKINHYTLYLHYSFYINLFLLVFCILSAFSACKMHKSQPKIEKKLAI